MRKENTKEGEQGRGIETETGRCTDSNWERDTGTVVLEVYRHMHNLLHRHAHLLEDSDNLQPHLRSLLPVVVLHAGWELARRWVASELRGYKCKAAVGGRDCHFAEEGFVGRCARDGVEVLGKGGHFALLRLEIAGGSASDVTLCFGLSWGWRYLL
jgi:hypothetical protein